MEHRRKEPVKKAELEDEANRVTLIVDFCEADVCETVTSKDGISTFVAFKSMSEIETTTFESVLSRIAGTISTGIDETTTVIFKKRLNTGWRKNTFKTEPGLTEGTTAAAEVELAGATREEVATMPVNTALLTRVSGSAKSIEDCK